MESITVAKVFRDARKLKPKDRLRLLEKLRQDRLNEILETIGKPFRNANISYDDITAIVNRVRQERYEKHQSKKTRH